MFSIIIPVYKVENDLARCVESVLAQTRTDWELILVDDGSPDRSGEICDAFSRSDSRIRSFHKENGGVSSARNLGLDNARGEWVIFVDGDDTVAPDYLQLIADNADNDLLVFGMAMDRYTYRGQLAESECKLISMPLTVPCSAFSDNFACLFRSLTMDSSCCKAFKKSIIDGCGLRFNADMICYEDFDFVIRYIACCKSSIKSIPFIAYHYIQTTDYNPLQRRNNRNIAPSIFILLSTICNNIKPERLTGINRETYFYLIASKIGLILDYLRDKSYSEAKTILKEIAENGVFRKYRNEIISHSPFFKRLALKYNRSGFRYPAYILNKLRP